MEGEKSTAACESTDTAVVERVAGGTDTITVGDDLVGSTGVTVAIAVKNFITLALTYTVESLHDLSLRTAAGITSNDDHVFRAD